MLIILISGPSGSGKTTVADKLQMHYGNRSRVFSLDSYYKKRVDMTFEQRAKINFDDPDSSDLELAAIHLQTLKTGKCISVPIYDFATHMRLEETREIHPEEIDILIVEGIFALQSQLLALGDVKVYVDTSKDLCFIRRLLRDIEERGRSLWQVTEQYLSTVRDSFLKFILPTKVLADCVIENHGEKSQVNIKSVIDLIDNVLSVAPIASLRGKLSAASHSTTFGRELKVAENNEPYAVSLASMSHEKSGV